jgi:HAD superfamily hydrolase (TIGR01493 family)
VLYAYWMHPKIYPESREVLSRCRVPVCLVSNIDNADLESALRHNRLRFDQVVTSEDCRAYKPRKEMFERALSLLGLLPGEVLHVGDSLSSDVRGAQSMGIPVLWINRRGRQLPDTAQAPDYVATELKGLLSILEA